MPGCMHALPPELTFEAPELTFEAPELTFEAAEVTLGEQNSVLKHQNLGNLRLYGDLYHNLDHQSRPWGGPDRTSVGFPKEKHGFVPCMCESSRKYRRIWTTRVAPWGAHVAQVHVFQKEKHGFVPSRGENTKKCKENGPPWGGAVPIGPRVSSRLYGDL